MKTRFDEIVNLDYIGQSENPVLMRDLLEMAGGEQLESSTGNERVLLLAIDMQQDFMEKGALGVPGAHKDIGNLCQFIYDNMSKIDHIAVSLDTHNPFQIFHPCWWKDAVGNHPAPFTEITSQGIEEGKWIAVINPEASKEYVENLEELGKKNLIIWPYHCLQGTTGAALENQFANMLYFYSVAKKCEVGRIVKGQDPLSEMYGIIKPEYDAKNYVNIDFLNQIKIFDKIIIAGEAKSHCVLESIKQLVEYYEDDIEITKRFYILEDCMSNIPGFEESTANMFEKFKTTYKVNIVKSTELIL